ncbi:restriction endonuclease subunit S [Enterococcus faecium]|nr:restriction endonuclease subunit S [Enterococcus faecium]MCD5113360.1 restriction endonuclease subunit S [Enterococcus faecium]
MPEKWEKVKLSDVATIKYGKDHKKLDDGKIPVYGTGGVMRYVDTPLYGKKSVLIPRKGSLGSLFFVEKPFWTVDTLFYTEIDENRIIPEYLYYKLKTFDLANMNVGSAVPSLTTAILNPIEFELPPIEVQSEIAKTLGVLDKKIESNKEINHHLSVIVQAIFNSWFVDYVPFGGTLPSEWKEVDFDEISTVQNGYAFKSKDYVSDGVRMIRTTNFDNGYVNNNDLIMLPSEFYNDAKYRNFVLKKFDTVLVMVGASVGKISLITELNTPALQNQNMWRFRSIIPEIPESFIHFNVKRINDQVRGWSSGSARDFYRKDIFKKAKVYLPTSQVLDDFSKITMPIFEQISNNILENDKLIKARDSLLPKLMSGEVSVTD